MGTFGIELRLGILDGGPMYSLVTKGWFGRASAVQSLLPQVVVTGQNRKLHPQFGAQSGAALGCEISASARKRAGDSVSIGRVFLLPHFGAKHLRTDRTLSTNYIGAYLPDMAFPSSNQTGCGNDTQPK